MDFVINTLWKPASFKVITSPLKLVSLVQSTAKSAPQKLLRNIYNSCVFETATTTSPAELINTFYKPIESPKTTRIINELREKIPIVDNIWEKLHVTPNEWYNYLLSSMEPHPNEDIGLTSVEMIRRNGYPVEIYEDIVTEDGYLLEVYRIPHGRTNKNDGTKPVVFLVHGFITSSADYVMAGPERGLAYLLADAGYDVWLGNPRGSLYSRKHVVHDPDCDRDFWKFSFHEIGIYDLPAMIDLILDVTKQKTITYIGMSQGTATFFTMASEKPVYNQHINLMVALAPVSYFNSTFSLINKFRPFVRSVLKHSREFIAAREFPGKRLQKTMATIHRSCQSKGFFQDIVVQMLFKAFGPNYSQLDTDTLPVLMSTIPHTSSTNQLLHFGQIAVSGQFQKFDHGPETNLEKYGTPEPPQYNLNNIEAPVALFYSNGDRLSKSEDVIRLHNALPNCVCLHEIEDQNFNHMDYVIGMDMVTLLNKHVIKLVGEYNPCKQVGDEYQMN